MPNIYSPASAAFRRIVKDGARAAIHDWLRRLRRGSMYLFSVNGVECALEHTTGHWGFEENGRWRWGRVDAGDPDEDLSGEDVLLEIALGRKLSPEPPLTARLRRDLPVLSGGADLARHEIRAQITARVRENLGKIDLHLLPPA